jgi:ribosomal protein L29
MRRFGSERVAQILRRIKAMSDQELIEQILALENGIDMSGFDLRDLTDAELASLIAELKAGQAEEDSDLASAQPNADPL